MEILTGNFAGKFKERLRSARKVQIASAWLSDSDALEALLLKPSCRVQAIIGVNGNSTSPDSVLSLAGTFGWANVRIADRHGPLFHPKLLIFHYSRQSPVAWIGSANFTGHGMEVNKELVLQTDDKGEVRALCEWFDKEWTSAPANPEERLAAYTGQRKQPGRFEGDRGGVPKVPQTPVEVDPQSARHLPSLRERDNYRFMYFGMDRWARSYRKIAENVLVAFADADSGFLERFERMDRNQVSSNDKYTRRYLTQTRSDVGESPPEKPLPIPGGWWMPQQLNDNQFFQGSDGRAGILKAACDVAGVTYAEGDAGAIDFQATRRSKPRGFDKGRVVVARIGKASERGRLGL